MKAVGFKALMKREVSDKTSLSLALSLCEKWKEKVLRSRVLGFRRFFFFLGSLALFDNRDKGGDWD